MATTSAVRLMASTDYRHRKELLRDLIESVNKGCYAPVGVSGFLSAPKGNGVARFIPVFSYPDTAIYFACVQQIDESLASARVPQTFGGWQLGNARRIIEEAEAIRLFGGEGCPSMPVSCYNRGAWMKHWQEYWKLLAAQYEDADEGSWFAMFDIANFYDSVDLERLQTNVRAAGAEECFAINVLFEILSSWNRALRMYMPNTKGLPMDLVGDCSRAYWQTFSSCRSIDHFGSTSGGAEAISCASRTIWLFARQRGIAVRILFTAPPSSSTSSD